eukprot:TRINITY_DN5904_c0_g1_i1.p1 TRINITY_DN5904_c0_g1~~TRINITY_DN5904_c0_g1_i1.p1  ORF type:complete len:1078 (+),score=322.90 TRINITY_DN5904_c0_g1_i1:114-3347(+)
MRRRLAGGAAAQPTAALLSAAAAAEGEDAAPQLDLTVALPTGAEVLVQVSPSAPAARVLQKLLLCAECCYITQYRLMHEGAELTPLRTLAEQGLPASGAARLTMDPIPYDSHALRAQVERIRALATTPLEELPLWEPDVTRFGRARPGFPSVCGETSLAVAALLSAGRPPPAGGRSPAPAVPTGGSSPIPKPLPAGHPEALLGPPPLQCAAAFPLVTLSQLDPPPERRLRGDLLCLDCIWGRQTLRVTACAAGFFTNATKSDQALDPARTSPIYETILGLLCAQLPEVRALWQELCLMRCAHAGIAVGPAQAPPTTPPPWLLEPPSDPPQVDPWCSTDNEFVVCQPADPRQAPRDWLDELAALEVCTLDRAQRDCAEQSIWRDFCEAAAAATRLAVDGSIFAANPEETFERRAFIQSNVVVRFCPAPDDDAEDGGADCPGPHSVPWAAARREAQMGAVVRSVGCPGLSVPLSCVVDYYGFRSMCCAASRETTNHLVLGGVAQPLAAGWAEPPPRKPPRCVTAAPRPPEPPACDGCLMPPEEGEVLAPLLESLMAEQLLCTDDTLPKGVRLLRSACGRKFIYGVHRLLPSDADGRPYRTELVRRFAAAQQADQLLGRGELHEPSSDGATFAASSALAEQAKHIEPARSSSTADHDATCGTNEVRSVSASSEQQAVSSDTGGMHGGESSGSPCGRAIGSPCPPAPSPRRTGLLAQLEDFEGQTLADFAEAAIRGEVDPCDGAELSAALHRLGLPLRRLGALHDRLPEGHRLRRLIEQEAAARCAKRILRRTLRRHRGSAVAAPVASVLNEITASATAPPPRQLEVARCAAEHFGVSLPADWQQAERWVLLRRVLQTSGVAVAVRGYDFSSSQPFRPGGQDILDIAPVCFACPPPLPTPPPASGENAHAAMLRAICQCEAACGETAEVMPQLLVELAGQLAKEKEQGLSAALNVLLCAATVGRRLWGRDSARVLPLLLAAGRTALRSGAPPIIAQQCFADALLVAQVAGGADCQDATAARTGYALAAPYAAEAPGLLQAARATHSRQALAEGRPGVPCAVQARHADFCGALLRILHPAAA